MPSPTPSPSELPLVTLPTSRRKLAMILAICVAFVGVGIAMFVFDPTVFRAVLAAVTIVFFGGGGILLMVRASRAAAVVVLTPRGLQLWSGGFVPWADLDAVGVGTTSGTRVIGLRLRHYDAYIASLTRGQRWLARPGHLAWARAQTGFDLTLPALLFGGSARTVVTAIEDYHAAWAALSDSRRTPVRPADPAPH